MCHPQRSTSDSASLTLCALQIHKYIHYYYEMTKQTSEFHKNLEVKSIPVIECMNDGSNELRRLVKDGGE